jgi:pimeloyl-ACP methyl ester carboxylesterase
MYPAFAPHVVARIITLDSGVRLRIAESGPNDGLPVVMLHGWGASLYMYRHALERFPNAGIRTIAVDLRGHGLSDKPHADDAYSLNAYQADIEALLDALGLSSVCMVGQSMGGGLALRYALTRPERVLKLALINPIALAEVPYISLLKMVPASIMAVGGRRLIPRSLIAFILRRLAYGDARAVTEQDVDEYWAPTQLPDFMYAVSSALNAFDWNVLTDAEAKALRAPALVILGKQDRLLFKNSYEAAARLNGARVELVTGGHCAHEEHPDLVYDMLRDFLRQD